MIRAPLAVLFACNLNAVRSPMAENLFKRRFAGRVFVDSCGVRAGETDPLMVAAMEELGLDLSRHRPKDFETVHDASWDLIVTLTPQAHHRALEAVRTLAIDVEYWPTMDPTDVEGTRDQQLDAYRQVRDALDRRIAERFAGLKPP
jgi:protein-tyrosine-phosphatase